MDQAASEFAELVTRARVGDSQAVDTLVRLYEQAVRVFARVHLGPALQPYLDSMDLVQSVHRSLLVGLRLRKFELTGPQNLVNLALTMVRRKIARQWRKHRRQQRRSPEFLPELLSTLSSAEPARVAQNHDSIVKLCQHLSDKEQQIIELRLQGFTNAESAQQLGVNVDTLRATLSRLRRRLGEAGIMEELL
jgi:RNA polymerase sigma-70 factor (ECF subfamily)